MEYIAFFLALAFPGALVAFNDASLQLFSGVASLRIYCAGIWHNAVVTTHVLFSWQVADNPWIVEICH